MRRLFLFLFFLLSILTMGQYIFLDNNPRWLAWSAWFLAIRAFWAESNLLK